MFNMLKESTLTLENAKLSGRRPKAVTSGWLAGLGTCTIGVRRNHLYKDKDSRIAS